MPVSIVEGDASCPERVLVTGDERVPEAYKGIFDKTTIVPLERSHGRAVYWNTEVYLYLNLDRWEMALEYNPTAWSTSEPVAMSVPMEAACPQRSAYWALYFWTAGSSEYNLVDISITTMPVLWPARVSSGTCSSRRMHQMCHPVLCARADALLHLHAVPASLWEARPGGCIYASESEAIYNSATESVPCGSVDDGFTFNCSCNDVSLAEEKTPRAAIAATVGLAAATISDAKSSAAIPTATWEDMPVSIVGASAGHGR